MEFIVVLIITAILSKIGFLALNRYLRTTRAVAAKKALFNIKKNVKVIMILIYLTQPSLVHFPYPESIDDCLSSVSLGLALFTACICSSEQKYLP